MRYPVRTALLSLAAATIVFAASIDTADAQRRGGGGFHRGGGFHGGGAMIRGGGFHRGFVGGPGIRRGFVGGPRFVGGRHFVGHRFGHRRHFFGHRRFARFGIGAGFIGVGAYPYYAGYYGGCNRWRLVPTPWGPQYRLINVCYGPVGYGGYGGYGGYPYGYYGGVY
jgi:hypothetical protein